MANENNTPTIEVAKKAGSDLPPESEMITSDSKKAIISTYDKSGSAAVMDNTVTREVVPTNTLPLDYQYDEKQMMANMSVAINADIEDMTETELLSDETFGYASKKMFRALRGEDFRGTDKEATQYGIDLMRKVENNLVSLGDFAVQTQEMTQEDAKTALYMMDMFEAKEFTGRGFVEAMGYMGIDPTTYLGIGTLGYGFAGREVAKTATKKGIRSMLQKVAYSPTAIGAVEGGAFVGAFEHGKQTVSEAAGEGYDSGSLGLNMAVGTGFGAVAGKYLPELFGYAGAKVSKWAIAKNFKKEVQLAADAGDADAIQVLADMELLDNYFDADGFMRRKLDEFEQTRIGQAVTGVQRIVPEDRKPVDEIILESAGLNAKQRKQKLSAAMRDASPEDREKLIAEMRKETKAPKAKTEKQKEVILEQEEFNASFYSKLEHEVNKLPDDMVFQNGQELVDYMRKQGVKQDEIDATGFDIAEGGLITGANVKSSLPFRKDTITKRTYDESTETPALDREDWESEWVRIDEQTDVSVGEAGFGARVTDDSTGLDREIGIVYDDEVYVDDSGYEYDYDSMLNDYKDNYYDGKYDDDAAQAVADGEIDEDDIDSYVIEQITDNREYYDHYSSKILYENTNGDKFDDMQQAIDDELDYMHENYTQYMGEEASGGQIFEEYTVDGGDDYRLEVYQMEEFEAPAGKREAQEPHFGGLEHGTDNVQVHARMKTREDADGNTGTVLEEIQSQWEQDWRAAGGDQKPPTEEQVKTAQKRIDDIKVEYDVLRKEKAEVVEKIGDARAREKDATDEINYIAKETDMAATDEAKFISETERLMKVEKEAMLDKVGFDRDMRAISDKISVLNDEGKKLDKEVINWKEPSIATPPIKNRTQYTKLAMLDNLLNSLDDGENFFGWINGHIQNGGNIKTTQGMSQAYDIEMPRIIQKATGETPYMASFEDGRAIGQKDIYDKAKIYWDSKNAQDLEYYDNLAKEESDVKWYWKIDYTDALKAKLKDAKIQMYGVGGVAFVGANGESLEGEENGNQ